jgi:hypothetical protein
MMIRYEDPKSRKCPYCNKKCMKPAGTFSLMEDAPAGSNFEVIRESYICLICGLMLEFREVQKKVQDMRRTTDSTQLRELAAMRQPGLSELA